MNSYPLISVIIPFYNRDKYLAEAIHSVLDQSYPAIELILIDDGSTDCGAEIAQAFLPRARYLYQPNSGVGAARNAGISAAMGEFIAFLDSDDIWVKDKLTKQMAVLTAHPKMEAVFGYAQQFYSPDVDDAFRQRIICPEQAVPAKISAAMLIRQAALIRTGLFDTELKVGIDIRWYIAAVENGLQHHVIPEVVYHRRLHKNNGGILQRHNIHQHLHILKGKLDRQRQNSRR